MARIFISHSSKDRATTDAIGAHMAKSGNQLFLDHDRAAGIVAGADWERTLYDRLQWADALVCVVTAAHIESRWCFAEVAIAKAQGRLIVALNAEAGARHPLLGAGQGLDYAAQPADALARLDARLASIDAGGGVAWDATRPVFPGLRAFDVEDRAMFFGRDPEVQGLLGRVKAQVVQRQTRGMVVVGASGSGKSSLVRAGLVPRLLEEPGWWRLRPFTPGRRPLAALAEELARARKEVGLPPDLAVVTAALPGGLDGVAREILLTAAGDRRRLLVVVDQLDEIFTRAASADRDAFVAALAGAAADPDGAVSVVATLRSEFMTELVQLPDGKRLAQDVVPLAPLGREHLEDVIARPLAKARIGVEPALVRRLVGDTGAGEALPLLAFALARLVEGLGPGEQVTVRRYDEIGGVAAALQNRAEAALADAVKASGQGEDAIVTALTTFVTLDDTGRRTRRARPRAEVADGVAAAAAIDAFVQARLLVADATDAGPVLSVAHETLFSAWPRLKAAIDAAEDGLRLRRALEQAVAEWEREGRHESFLWRGPRLMRALAAKPELGAREHEFLAMSAAREGEVARRESAILVDRVVQAGLVENDPELALLYLLTAVDQYTPTPDAIAALRLALARQRMVARVGPTDARIQQAAMSPDGALVAIADAGTNPMVRPSTRPQPPPPAGNIRLSIWAVAGNQPVVGLDIAGRRANGLAWSHDAAALAIAVESRVLVLDARKLSPISELDVVGRPRSLRFWGDWGEEIEVSTSEGAAQEQEPTRYPSGFRGSVNNLTRRVADVPPPPRFTHLVPCEDADRLLDIRGNEIDVWAANPVDASGPIPFAAYPGVPWVRPKEPGVLAIDSAGDRRCRDQPLRLEYLRTGDERELPIGFAVDAAFSSDGRLLALASRTELTLIEISTGRIIKQLGRHGDEEGDTYTSVAVSDDGSWLASGSLGGGRSHLWDVGKGAPVRSLGGKWVGLSDDGRLAAAAAANGGIDIHLSGGQVLKLGEASGRQFAFAPDGSAVLVWQDDQIVEYSLHDGNVAGKYPLGKAMAFSPDSRHVLIRDAYDTRRYPDRTPEAVIARARRAVYRSLTPEERRDFELDR